MSAARLAGLVYVSGDLVEKVEKAQRTASVELIAACDTALDTGGALGRLLDFAVHHECAPDAEPEAVSQAPASPHLVSILLTITAEVAPPPPLADAVDSTAAGSGGARIYRFPSFSASRRRS